MYAIDTNVLVRIIVKDDEAQTKKAKNYVEKCGEVFISLIVLCEFSWVVTSVYEFTKRELLHVMELILKTEEFITEESDIVWNALNEFKRINAEFSDCLIGAVAKHYQCLSTGTFDKKASSSSFFEWIG